MVFAARLGSCLTGWLAIAAAAAAAAEAVAQLVFAISEVTG